MKPHIHLVELKKGAWVTQATILCLVLGMLLAASLKTQQNIRSMSLPSSRFGSLANAYTELKKKTEEQSKEIEALNKKNTEYEEAIATGSRDKQALNDELQRVKVLAGLVPMKGPGLIITLNDSKKRPVTGAQPEDLSAYIVHDTDIRNLINELNATGAAEAISVNDQRVIANTAIRCVGPVLQVNKVPTSQPYIIKVIGDANMLTSGLKLPGGVFETLDFLEMIKIKPEKEMFIPPYSGSTQFQFAHPAEAKKTEEGQE
ncbi:MAG: DUF881 domain-containing protein [Armatimonadetes bacterium]|nr:DUF881 domain-containing protein [Armatimonadota bacterium]